LHSTKSDKIVAKKKKKKQSSKCKNINNSQNPKGETKTEVYMPKKKEQIDWIKQ
jgi:hypothetical protein